MRWLAALVVLALAVPMATGASAAADAKLKAAVAVLKIQADKVQVRRKGAKKFKAARDGQKLHAGDTVRTDETGFAEINYGDESFTRLDVRTTFKIKRLTDKQGDRRVLGSLDVGRTWNRAEGLAEADSFEMEGAGATAAVVGTAFVQQCDDDGCRVLAVFHDTKVVGKDDKPIELGPGNAVDALNGKLSEIITGVVDALANDPWVQLNLALDQARGIGPFVSAAAPTATTGGTTATSVKPGCGKGAKDPHAGNVPGC